jgi:O-antigen ligase
VSKAARSVPNASLSLIVFYAYAAISILWSDNATASLSRFATITSALLLAALLSAEGVQATKLILLKAGIVALTTSLLLVLVAPQVGISADERGAFWQGAFATKNVLGRFSALCILVALTYALSNRLTKRQRGVVWAATSLGAICLWNSGSVGALMSLGAGSAVAVAVAPLRNRESASARVAGATALFATVAGFYYLVLNRQSLGSIVGRDASLTGRATIWKAANLYADEKPILGYGFGSFFAPESVTRNRISRALGADVPHAHNFFLDVRLDLGWLGVSLWTILVVAVIYRAVLALCAQGVVWPIALCSFILVSDIIESTSLNGVFPALLLAGAIRWNSITSAQDGGQLCK